MSWTSGWRSGIAWPAGVLLLGVFTTLDNTLDAWQRVEAEAHAGFERQTDRIGAEVARRLAQPIYGLNGARGVVAATGRFDHRELARYVASRDLTQEFPGVRGFGYIERVPRAELGGFVAGMRADGVAGFTVRQLSERDHNDLYVIKTIEPASRNAGAQGLDVGSEPRRREAAEQALRTGKPTLSAPVVLVQDERRSAGFVLFVPVSRAVAAPAPDPAAQPPAGDLAVSTPTSTSTSNSTSPAAPPSPVGLLYAPIVAAELLRDMPDVRSGDADFEIIDVGSTAVRAGETMVFDSRHPAAGATGGAVIAVAADRPPAAAAMAPRVARFHSTRTLATPGRQMTLRTYSSASAEAAISFRPVQVEFTLGLIVTLMLAAIVRQLQTGRRRAEALAERMTTDLARLALVAQRTSNAVLISDRNLRITWVNDAFTRLYGHTADAVRGRIAAEVLHSASASRPEAMHALQAAAAAGIGCRVELVNRAYDGRLLHVDSELQPALDTRGEVVGFIEVATDITAATRARSELALQQQRLASIIEGTQVGTWEWDLESGIVRSNDRWARIVGEAHDVVAARSMAYWGARSHPDDAALGEQLLKQHLRDTVAAIDFEGRVRHRDGHWVWVQTRGKVVSRDANGRAQRVAGTHTDITQRKQAEATLRAMEAELRRNNELLASVLENLPCGLSVFDGSLNLVASNREFRRLLGFPDTLFAKHPLTFEDVIRFNAERGEYGPGDIETRVATIVERARQTAGPHQFERVRPDGTPLEIRGAPMPGGGFVTTYTDISARRRAEAEVERSAALLRGAIDAIDEAFVLYDPEDRLVFCNDRYREVYHTVAHLMVPGASFESIIRPGAERGDYVEAIGRVDDWVAERLAAHHAANSTLVQRMSDGRTLRIVERKMPDGHIVGFRIDITELVQATERAEQASLAKSRFLANMSHEIRTPMNAVLGMLSLLKRTGLTPRQADYAAKSEGAARSLLGLLNDILDFSKIEADRMTLDLHPFRVDALMRDLGVILAGSVGDKPVALRFELDPALPRELVGDALRLQQVLTNLGGNAVKFTAAGEVVVAARVAHRRDDEVGIAFEVRDTGIGIAPENHARIFAGFTQAEASTTRRYGGTGLGLAISQRLVSMMGGRLELDSAVGKGSRFHFQVALQTPARAGDDEGHAGAPALRGGVDVVTGVDGTRLPNLDAGAARPALPHFPAPRRLAGMRLLVAEDNPNNQQVARELLEDEGAQVHLANDGEEAVAAVLAATTPFDAVLMDLQMPVMDGYGATARIRLQPGLQGLPIVAMTANATPADRRSCLDAGMNEHVGKPFDLDHLIALLLAVTGRALTPRGTDAATAAAARSRARPAASPGVACAAAVAGVDIDAALSRMGGKREVYRRLLEDFVADMPAARAGLCDALGASDAARLGRRLHTLRGVVATLGAAALAAHIARVEADVAVPRGKTKPRLDRLAVAAVQGLIDAVDAAAGPLRALAEALGSEAHDAATTDATDVPRGGTAADGGAAPEADLGDALQELAALLRSSDMAATDALAAIRRRAGADWQPQLQALDASVARLEFIPALARCNELIDQLAETAALETA